ncbi:MAG: molybdenum ABC transporter ATP-binding protein [Thermoanaerobaculia bacterium]
MNRLDVDIRLPLDRFDLEVELMTEGPVTGIFGPSGSGKSSLLETVAGLRRDATGRVRLGERVWLDSAADLCLPPEERDVGFVPQESLLFPHLDVRHNLLAGARRARRSGGDPEALLGEVCELLELGPLIGRDVSSLSGGERRRVALGRALCSGPRLLLLDEPLASLDLPLRRRLLPLLRRLRSELTTPMLLVSHDPIEVQALCDEMIVLRDGVAVERGEPHRVLADPRVFALADEAFENLLPARHLRREAATSVLELGEEGGGIELITLASPVEIGAEVLVGLPSSEIVLATERPAGLSARNVLPARVEAIRASEGWGLVEARLGSGLPPISVEVVETTPATLGITPGSEVFLVIKATSCRLYGG